MSRRNSPRARWTLGLALAATAFSAAITPPPARAAPVLRFTTDEHGDFAVFGNTLAHDCRGGPVPIPAVGSVGACGANTTDSAVDVFWRSDSPVVGQAEANTNITPAQARSQALLALPAGATVVYARLYWSGQLPMGATQVLFERPGSFSQTLTRDPVRGTVTADNGGGKPMFSSTVDVTTLIQQYGPGVYRVGALQQDDYRNVNDSVLFAGWHVVIFYRLNSQPTRNLSLFDGFDVVNNNTQTATINGFLVPNAGFDAKLAAIAYEGDVDITGDQLLFNGVAVSDTLNPANNFFNATRGYLGTAVTVQRDLPQYSGAPGSMNGLDIDVVDVTARLTAGAQSATIAATSTGDVFFLSTFATSISTLKPVFSDTNKTFKNLTRNDGSVKPGDTVEYTIVTSNSGTDTGINVTVRDPLPAQVTYLPGSLNIDGVAKTDQTGDDQAELVTMGAQQTIIARIGPGANATTGGTIKVGDPPSTIRFRVTVNGAITGLVRNQASVAAAGQVATSQGLSTSANWNSGNGKDPNVPTDLVVGDPTDLQVTVKDNLNGQLPVPGVPIIVTVDIKNLGPRDVTNGSVIAQLPQLPPGAVITWTCAPMGGGVCPAATGMGPIDTNNLNLPSGANITYTITIPNPVMTPVLNPVVLVTVQPPPSIPDIKQANNTASTGVSDLSITVKDNLNGMAVMPNMPSSFTVTVGNKGPSAAQDIVLSDVLPPGVNPATVTWTCMAVGNAICPAAMGTGSLPANGGSVPQNGQLVYTVNVPGQAMPQAANFYYQVGVAAPSPLVDPILSNNSASTAKADLAVAVTNNLGGKPPLSNMPVTYTLDVSNAGPNTVTNAQLSTTLPQGLANPMWTCVATGGAMCPATSGTGTPPAQTTLPPGGKLTYTVMGTAPTMPALPWAFVTTITPPGNVSDPNSNNNTASSIIAGQENGDLSIQITKTPDMAQVGQPTTYTALVNNTGPDTITNPTVVLNLPPGAMILMAPAGMGWTCTNSGSTYTCMQPTAPPGMLPALVAQIVTPAPPSQGGPGSTVVGIVGAPRLVDPNPSNNTAVVDPTGSPITTADLDLHITKNPTPSTLGQVTTYTLQLDNNGPGTAMSPTLNFTLPPNSIVTSFMPGPGWSCVQSGLSFTCIRQDLAPGSAPPVIIQAITPPPPDGSQNAGAVAGTVTAVQLSDPNPLNNSAVVAAGNPAATGTDLAVRLTRDPAVPTEGDVVTYTLQATNKGPDAANNVVVSLSVPPGAEILQPAMGDGWTCSQSLSTFVCTRPALAVGDAPPVTVKVRLGAQGDNSILPGIGGATATINADGNSDPNPADNIATLDGQLYKLEGGGLGCSAAPGGGASAGSVIALLLAVALVRRRRRSSQIAEECVN